MAHHLLGFADSTETQLEKLPTEAEPMAKQTVPPNEMELSTLVAEIVHDTGTLLSKQVELLRAELAEEARRAGGAAVSLAAGGGLMAAGGLLSGMMVAHVLQRTTRLPLWACYGLAGSGIGAAGLALLQEGREKIASVQLVPPPESAAALQENVAWLKNQMTPASQ
jgi:hypothetical protein